MLLFYPSRHSFSTFKCINYKAGRIVGFDFIERQLLFFRFLARLQTIEIVCSLIKCRMWRVCSRSGQCFVYDFRREFYSEPEEAILDIKIFYNDQARLRDWQNPEKAIVHPSMPVASCLSCHHRTQIHNHRVC